MSTRSTTHFIYGERDKPEAIVYRHSDGYPEGAGTDIYRFLREVRDNVRDNRFDDPSYLAAKYVVWLAKEYSHELTYDPKTEMYGYEDAHYLDFRGVGVIQNDPGDIDYRYYINCGNTDSEGYPDVKCFRVKANGKDWGDPEWGLVDAEEEDIPLPEE